MKIRILIFLSLFTLFTNLTAMELRVVIDSNLKLIISAINDVNFEKFKVRVLNISNSNKDYTKAYLAIEKIKIERYLKQSLPRCVSEEELLRRAMPLVVIRRMEKAIEKCDNISNVVNLNVCTNPSTEKS